MKEISIKKGLVVSTGRIPRQQGKPPSWAGLDAFCPLGFEV